MGFLRDRVGDGVRTVKIWVIVLMLVSARDGVAASEHSRAVKGIAASVEIVRDGEGIPHIFADTEADAYFALGYVHAEDRLWQMEMNRRSGSGTLAELLGASALSEDRLIRTVGLRRAAQANPPHLDAATREILAAYAAGVNAYLGQVTVLPPEFLVARTTPLPWSPEDSLTWMKMMAWTLSGNWWEELLNVRLREQLTARQVAELLPPYPGDQPRLLPDPGGLYGFQADRADALLAVGSRSRPDSRGSNNWVVSGARTKHGKPLLANDPHTRLSAPSLWYFAHLHAPGLNVIGATLPGVPGVFLGRNERVAWAFTNTGSDTQDLYVERLVDDEGDRYVTPGGAAPFERVAERIAVRGAAAETLPVRMTRHGPVISDVVEEAAGLSPRGSVIALGWVGLRSDDLTAQFMLHAAKARSAGELREAARFLHTPQQNVVFADVDGTIGFVAAGRVPVRKPRNDLMGLMPAPGWDERYDWDGVIAFEQLPALGNPPDGKIVTANQKVTPPDYPFWITSGWFPPYRADRIAELLDRTPRHDVASFAAIQSDVENPVAGQLLSDLLQWEPVGAKERAAVAALRAWDRRMTTDSREALLFVEWLRQLDGVLLKDRLGELYQWLDDYNPVFLKNVLSRHDDPSGWCGPPTSDGQPACRKVVESALSLALAELERRYGSDQSRWSWGRAHVIRSGHLPAGALGFLGRWLDFQIPGPGGRDTVNVSGYAFDTESGLYVGDTGASFRAIYDLGNPEESVFILNTGQSGNPLSSHYGDMVDDWRDGRYVPMRTARRAIIEHARDRLILSPG